MSKCILVPPTGPNGYGIKQIKGKKWLAHRLAYTEAFGPIPEGMFVLHKCDVRNCINTDHLFLGTQADNNRDMARKGRHWNSLKTHCPKGHPYDEANTRVLSGNRRGCRACHG